MLASFKSPLTLTGRVLLALMFVDGGVSKLANSTEPPATSPRGLPMPRCAPCVVALLEVIAGLALAVGLHARWAALALGVFTVLASVLFHKSWAVPPEQQVLQQLMFLKNMAVAGGMLIVPRLGARPGQRRQRSAATARLSAR